MGSLIDQMMKPDPILAHQRMLEADYESRKLLHNEEIKDKLLNDPTYSDQILAHLSRSAMPDKVAAKIPVGANFDKVITNIDAGDPRRKMIEQLQKDMPGIIKNSPYGTNPADAIMSAVQERGKAATEDVYKFIQSKEGFFGGANKKIAPAEGYDEWREAHPTFSNPLANAAIGAGGELASMPILAKAAKMASLGSKLATPLRFLGGALSMAPPIGPVGVGAKLAGAGLMAATAFGALDAVKKVAAESGHPMGLGGELLAGLPIFGGLNMLAKKGGAAVAKGASALARDLPNAAEFAGVKATNEFDRLASGKLVAKPPVSRDDIAAVAKAERLTLEESKANLMREESYKKLNDDDLKALTLNPEKAEEIKAAAYARNKENAVALAKFKDESIRKEVVESADYMFKNKTVGSIEEGLARAARIITPSAEQTVKDSIFLKEKFGFNDEQLASLSARDRAELTVSWEQHANPAERQLTVAKEPDFLPPAIARPKVPAFKVVEPTQINAGMPDRKLLTGPNQPTIYADYVPIVVQGENAKTLERLRSSWVPKKLEEKAAAKAGELPVITKAMIKPTPMMVIKDFEKEVKDAGQAIMRDSKTPTEKAVALNHLSQMMDARVDQVAAQHGIKGLHYEELKNALKRAKSANAEAFSADELAVLEKKAQEDAQALVKEMGSTEKSPIGVELGAKVAVDDAKASKIQQAKEWFSIFGHKGKITFEEFKANEDKIRNWEFKWDTIAKYGVAATTLAGLMSVGMLAPNTADASTLGTGAKLVMGGVVKDAAAASGRAVEEVTEQAIAKGYGAPVLSEDGHGVTHLMRSPSFAPADVSVFPKTNVNFFDRILSPGHRDDIHLDARYADGSRAPFGIGKEVGYRSQVILANTDASVIAVNNILKDAGIVSQLDEVTAHMQPLIDKFHKVVDIDNPYYNGRLEMLDKVLAGKYNSPADTKLKNLSQLLRAAKGDVKNIPEEYQEMYKIISTERQAAADKIAELKPTVDSFQKEYEQYAKAAAERFPTARVSLATDGYGMQPGNSWLDVMLTPAERKAVQEIKAINDAYAVRMKETGHDVIAGPYMHHPAHPSVNYADDLKYADGAFNNDGKEAMRLVNFYHRSAGSRLMIPDTHYVMGKYLPDVNKRIEISDMWKMGREGGWDAARKQMQARGGYDGALKLIDDVRTAFDPLDTGNSAKWLNRYAAFEVARLLTLSPSVSFKHALKLMGNWTIFPADVSAKATAENWGLQARQYAQDMAGEAYRGKDSIADLSRALTSMHHTYAAVSDMAPYELPTSVLDKFLTKWNQAGSAAVNAVERWDRGQTFISSMMMAQKKGMTPEQALFGLTDSVLRVNFLTGPNNPKWLKDPFIRTMMMFQGTPFKILEQRAMLGYQGGKDLLGLLTRLRSDVKLGEERFKWNMLNDERMRSDVFGNQYSTQLLKQMMVIGTVIGTGKYVFDSDMWGHTIHIPGLQLGDKGLQLGVNPIIGAAYQTLKGSNKTDENEDDFALSRFFNSWLGQSGFPAVAHKVARLNADDIPAMYKDSKLSYLFGVPRLKEE